MQRNRRQRFLTSAVLALAVSAADGGCVRADGPGASVMSDRRVIDASAFLGGIGVNAHVSWPGHYPYSHTSRVVEAMQHLGVRNLRDHINSGSVPAFERLAASGVRFNLLLNPVVGVDNYIGWASRLARTYPGSVKSLEGPNEVDKWPLTYDGVSSYAAAVATQKALYAKARADRLLARVPVYNVTVSGISRSNSAALGDLSAHADYANVHPYYRAGQQSWGHSRLDPRYTLENYIASAQWSAPGRPVVITETGSTTSPGSAIGVTEEVQAKQILNSLMAAAKHRVATIYIYELVDSHNGGPTDVESHYGLYRYDWSPKPAATALHNLTRILGGRPAGGRRSDAGPAPTYTLTGLPDTGSSLLFQGDDGTYDLVVWAEPDPWQETFHRAVVAPPVTVRVALGSRVPSIAVYDPLVGSAPLRTLGPASGVTVTLTDHPLIIRLSPAPTAARTIRP